MRILVCGDRNWSDPAPIRYALESILDNMGTFELVEGGARGADWLAADAAVKIGVVCHEVKAEWDKYGLAAGPMRNERMLVEFKPDLVLAFHDRLNFSKGTRDMIDRAQAAGLHVILYTHGFGCCAPAGFHSLPRIYR